MIRCLFLLSLLIHATLAKKDAPKLEPDPEAPPAKKWLTLNGEQPVVVARGGFSGLFPESSPSANDMAVSTSLPDTAVMCSLQLTQDGVGICLTDLRLDNSTTISSLFPKGQKTYNVNGQDLEGWFAIDYTADTILNNVSLVQNIYSRPSAFDGQMPIAAVEDVMGVKPPKFWLSVQYDAFYNEHKLSVAEYLRGLQLRGITFISSPEIGFLKSIGLDARKSRTKLIFEFKDPEAMEPTTKKKYSEIQKDLAAIKMYASGILVTKDYVWPLDSKRYLMPSTTLVDDAHKAGLEVYVTGFANDMPASYNYSYDPSVEYLQFVDNSKFAVDGVVTDFPPTASQAIACFAQQNMSLPKIGQALIITHNGASGDYPGCTDLAYQQAIDDGADIIDCSVQLSKDGTAFCHDTPDLTASSTATTTFMTKSSKVPEIQNTSGIFSFDLTWSEIQSLKPQIESPYLNAAGFPRNPANKNVGKFMTLKDFLELAKTKKVAGILINIEHAAFLASNKGLGIVDTVKSALTNATFDKQSTQKVLIQSDDSSVLSNFQGVDSYKRVMKIDKEIGDVPKLSVDEIKKYADAVNVKRTSLVTVASSFAVAKTNVLKEMKAANISVYVSVLRNEYISIAFDYFSDPTVELATFVAGIGVDGVVTEYPATANRYMRSPCSDLNQNQPYPILPAEPGQLLSAIPKEALPPASAPNPSLEAKDVIDPPLPAVIAKETTPNATAGGAAGPSHAPAAAAATSFSPSLVASLVLVVIAAGI